MLVEESGRRKGRKLPQFSRQSLTHVRKKGINALGVIELTIVLSPLLIQQALGADVGPHGEPQGIGPVARIVSPLLAAAVAFFDLWWRWREEPNEPWWVRAISADAGGSLVWLPTWVLWAAFAAFGAFLLIVQPHQAPSPYGPRQPPGAHAPN